jgi:hypothetical protein
VLEMRTLAYRLWLRFIGPSLASSLDASSEGKHRLSEGIHPRTDRRVSSARGIRGAAASKSAVSIA